VVFLWVVIGVAAIAGIGYVIHDHMQPSEDQLRAQRRDMLNRRLIDLPPDGYRILCAEMAKGSTEQQEALLEALNKIAPEEDLNDE
jgi:hypothetical protein